MEHYEITYTDRHTGREAVHTFSGDRANALGWAEALSRENGNCPAVVEEVDKSSEERRVVGGVGHRR